jgi:Glycosyl hydrolase family 63 C-terminal domain
VHAWACWRVYKMTGARGERDRLFLARVFQKLLLNFTWWVNRKDPGGHHVFSGGFLGLDNIGVFDRSKPLPTGGQLVQADGTAWMAFYCSTMLAIALELAEGDPSYEDIASKFFEHFIAIADAMNHLGGTGLWHEEDGFYYDQLYLDGRAQPLRLRSMVGIIPLFAIEFIEEDRLDKLPGFAKRTRWFLENRKDLVAHISYMTQDGATPGRRLLAIPSKERLERVLRYVFDENEFLSPYGIRSMSKIHEANPFVLRAGGEEYRVGYVPGESDSGLFGGNSNWRGPIWFPLNFLLIEALERYHHFYGDSLTVEFPTGSGRRITLKEAAQELSRRLVKIFVPDDGGTRACHGPENAPTSSKRWDDMVLFHEYFHAETGRGLGASHQTGWTALVARLIESRATKRPKKS